MLDSQDSRVTSVPSVDGAAAVQPVRPQPPVGTPVGGSDRPQGHEVAAITGGSLRAAAAQLFVDPDTHDVVIRIKDPTTSQIISEYPTAEVEAMEKYMRQYANTLARHRVSRPAATAQ